MSLNMPSEFLLFFASDPLTLLSQVRQFKTQHDIAVRLQVDPKTISRWEWRKTDCPTYVQAALREMLPVDARPDTVSSRFTYAVIIVSGGPTVACRRIIAASITSC